MVCGSTAARTPRLAESRTTVTECLALPKPSSASTSSSSCSNRRWAMRCHHFDRRVAAERRRVRARGRFVPRQLVTYGFLHGGFSHIFFNMFAVYMFGSTLERFLGTRSYVMLYFVSVVTAGLTSSSASMRSWARRIPRSARRAACSACCSPSACSFHAKESCFSFSPIPMPAWVAVTARTAH